MVLQDYLIHLRNGEKVNVMEPYNLTGPKALINRYQYANPESVFCVGDPATGFHYFKAKDIVQITTLDVREVEDKDWEFMLERNRRDNGDKHSGKEQKEYYVNHEDRFI